MELADLATWTPIALDLTGPQPTIDWCDLTDIAFTEPFFDQTVMRARADRPVVRTDLDALLALDDHPSLEPCGLIFHMSRCGSTLVSRLLQAIPGNLVVVEPAPLNALLEAPPDRVDEATRIRVIRLLVRALGRVRAGSERRLIVKLSSWNVRRATLIKQAFPDVPTIWLQRAPAEVAASLAARPPGWLRSAAALAAIFEIDRAAHDEDGLIAGALGAMLEAAVAMRPDRVFDYSDLPRAVWDEIAALFDIPVTADDVVVMRARSLLSAKSPSPVPFVAAQPATVSGQVADRLMRPYRRLDAQRAAAIGPAPCSN